MLDFSVALHPLTSKFEPWFGCGFSGKRTQITENRHEDRRERLIDATLDLCKNQGYDATTVDQIAAAADVTPSDFARHFATKDAVIMSIFDDLLHASVTALQDVKTDIGPEHAMLIATIEVHRAIIEGRGVITRDRMLAIARILISTSDLRKQASAARKRVLTQAFADRMGVGSGDRRVQRAVTTWSAIATGAYIGQLHTPANYDPRHGDWLSERMIANLSDTFAEVMGEAPWQQE